MMVNVSFRCAGFAVSKLSKVRTSLTFRKFITVFVILSEMVFFHYSIATGTLQNFSKFCLS